MIIQQQIKSAIFGSVVLHLLFAFGITTMLAYKRSLPPDNDDFKNASDSWNPMESHGAVGIPRSPIGILDSRNPMDSFFLEKSA